VWIGLQSYEKRIDHSEAYPDTRHEMAAINDPATMLIGALKPVTTHPPDPRTGQRESEHRNVDRRQHERVAGGARPFHQRIPSEEVREESRWTRQYSEPE
jgi:hypothetical protein